jgi:hypothetical protein
VLKLREYVERKHSTVDENRLIMSHASTWWRWSRDAALRCKSYLRNDSMTNRTRDSILHLMISFESSLISHAMTSNRDHYIDHHFDHHLKSERIQQTRRQDDSIDEVEAVWQRWDQITKLEDELWLMTITLSRWVDHLECMRRLPRLNESKNGYIERSKFSHLVDRQREKFSLYQSN